ncbi:hypothetical protein [Rhodococcus qingshengii]|uniref:hypothetical protein n=1 Tax=Rhodococcus qingshengii TaxID=334542 RepID=UPI002035E105|nr:hypothetical protein [Rhodococcus qingshengii]
MSELSGGGDRAGKLTEMAGGRRVDLVRRRLTREYVMEAVMTEWVQMLVTMADGPRQPVHGVVVPYRNSDEPFHYYHGSYGEEPVFLPVRLPGVHQRRRHRLGLHRRPRPAALHRTPPGALARRGPTPRDHPAD